MNIAVCISKYARECAIVYDYCMSRLIVREHSWIIMDQKPPKCEKITPYCNGAIVVFLRVSYHNSACAAHWPTAFNAWLNFELCARSRVISWCAMASCPASDSNAALSAGVA